MLSRYQCVWYCMDHSVYFCTQHTFWRSFEPNRVVHNRLFIWSPLTEEQEVENVKIWPRHPVAMSICCSPITCVWLSISDIYFPEKASSKDRRQIAISHLGTFMRSASEVSVHCMCECEWVFSECSPGIFWVFYESSLVVLRLCSESAQSVFWVCSKLPWVLLIM